MFGKQKAVYLPVLSGPLSPLQGFNIYLNFRGQMSNMKIFYEQNNFINFIRNGSWHRIWNDYY